MTEGWPLYVRFGGLPENGLSTTYRREALELGLPPGAKSDRERGVSVFRGRRKADGTLAVDVVDGGLLRWLLEQFIEQKRPVYLASGREVGVGASGEPVLADVDLEPLPRRTRVEGLSRPGRRPTNRPCEVCEHPQRDAIDEELAGGRSPRSIRASYPGLSRVEITAHRDGCMGEEEG